MINEVNNKRFLLVFLFCFLLLPFMGVAGIRDLIGDQIYRAWQVASMSLLGAIVIVNYKEIKIKWGIILFAAYQFVIIMSTTLHHGFSFGIVVSIAALVLLFVLLQTDYYYEILTAVAIIVVITLLANAISMIGKSNIRDAQFFIGGKNALGLFLIPGSFILLINSFESNERIRKSSVFALILCLGSVFIGASGTGIIVAAFTLFLLILSYKFKINKMVALGIIIAVYAILLLFPEDFLLTEYWLKFTESLGKNQSMTSRTDIWQLAKGVILDNFVLGSGRGTELTYLIYTGEWKTVDEAHNFILEIMMEGGIIALVLFGTMFFKIVKNLNISKRTHNLVFVALCIILINGLTESTINNFFVVAILAIACRYADEEIALRNNKWITDSKS